jgi:glycosyltransferase involved in cell wall biosynthesis
MIIIIAPHLEFPSRNGADIYIERIGCYLSIYRAPVIILGENTLTRYEKGAIISQSDFSNRLRTKTWAAIRTLVLRSHYLLEKYLTSAYRKKAMELVQENPEAIIVYSSISSGSLALAKKTAFIVTQNDEIAFYRKQQAFTKNPLQKMVATFSEKWLLSFLSNSRNDHIYIHITDADQKAYSNFIPKHRSIIVPAGVDCRPSVIFVPSLHKTIHLLFCGSLSVKMNLDALLFFKDKFWGLLKECFHENIDVWIAGSHPTSSVINLCKNQGWALHSDISDDDLNSLYAAATFGILPFEYSDGAKIKLLNCLAAGLPVLATNSVKTKSEQDFPPNLFSNDPNNWLDHLQKYQERGDEFLSGRIACQKFSVQYSWLKIAEKLDSDLKTMGI